MSEAKMHTGGCHCGAVRYEVTTDLASIMSCNCSMCGKAGTWLSFVPMSQFKLTKGEDMLTDYQFNKKVIHHFFCKVCGVRSFARGVGPDEQVMVGVNVRCLDDVDLDTLSPTAFNGKSL